MVMADDPESSEDDVSTEAHNKLLDAVSKMYKKKRVDAPTRKEPTLEISEFHLTQPESRKKSTKVKINDLVKVLKKKSKHDSLTNKLKQTQKQSKTLMKPLQKPQAERIGRAIGYKNVKDQLNRWDPIVYQQRVAERLTFPLRHSEIKAQKSDNFLTTFSTPTELELKMAEILKQSDIETKKQAEEKKDKENEDDEFPLTLAELVERRKIMAKIRAQQSYKGAKAARQNKIKSKKFHRIQKRERIKNELKEFEELQKKDPEAALKKLEQLEKTRAEERASLRHKSTGQWAKNLTVRAKYDKEARIALAEQLNKSRQLTQKLQSNKDTSEEEESESDDKNEVVSKNSSDPNNPWVENANSEVQKFYSGFKKYWNEKNKTNELNESEQLSGPIKKIKNVYKTEQDLGNTKSINNHNVKLLISKEVGVSNEQVQDKGTSLNVNLPNDKLKKKRAVTKQHINHNSKHNMNKEKKLDVTISNKKGHKQSNSNDTEKVLNKNNNPKMIIGKSGIWTVTPVNVLKRSNSGEVLNEKKKKASKKNTKTSSLMDLVDAINVLEEKVKPFKAKTNKGNRFPDVDNAMEESDSENVPSLEMKMTNITADVDEELDEVAGPSKKQTKSFDNVKKLLVSSDLSTEISKNNSSTKTDDIDPNKFLAVTPKYLKSQVPDLMTAGEQLDDEEDKEEQRHLTISEAFADDDIVDEFRKDKEQEAKKGKIENIDLSLPGWGSWGGPNLTTTTRRKRKKFMVKFPKVISRKDDKKSNVIINEDKDLSLKEHRVTDLPFPFTSVKDFEASIRAPIGTNWVPETAHRKLIVPPVLTKMGTIIEPMDESQLVKNKDLQFN